MTPDDGTQTIGGSGTIAPPAPTTETPPTISAEAPSSLVAPAAATPSVAPGTPLVNPDGTFIEGWTNHLPEELRADSLRATNFRSVEELTKGFINAQKMIGRRGVFVPSEKSTPEEISEFRRALGVPETPEGYEAKPEQLPPGIDWNDDLAKPFLDIAHKHNIPKAAMKDLVAMHVEIEKYRGQAMEQQTHMEAERSFTEGTQELQNTWRGDFDSKMMKVRQAAAVLGVPVTSKGFEDPAIVKAFAMVAERYIAEDKLVAGGAGLPGALNGPAMAKDIRTNENNPYYKRYQEGDQEVAQLARQYDQMK